MRMNKGTRIRALASVLDIVLIAVTILFPFKYLLVKVLVIVVNALVIAANHWFNNDWTEEGCLGTGNTRQRKREMHPDYIGERFFEIDRDKLEVEEDE